MIYTRGVVSTIRNNFEEHPFKLDECIRFITSNLKNDKNTYIRMGIKRDDVRKDFSFLCEAISRQIKNFMEIPDYSVYDFVKDMYYELILNDDNKDFISKQYIPALQTRKPNPAIEGCEVFVLLSQEFVRIPVHRFSHPYELL